MLGSDIPLTTASALEAAKRALCYGSDVGCDHTCNAIGPPAATTSGMAFGEVEQ